MKRIVLLCIIFLATAGSCWAVGGIIPSTTIFECRATATANNVNGGGFDPANAGMLTDLAADTNTGNTESPVVSSASYNFAAGDVGHWLYVKAGTNWVPGWYRIASVGSNKATLAAGVGIAVLGSGTGALSYNTSAGCSTAATPTGGTFTIDYSQSATAIKTNTDLTCTAGSTTITATTGFTPVMVGNIIHLTALTGTGAIIGWYEIMTYVGATQITLDHTPTDGANNITAGTFYVGGAMSLNSTLDDDFCEAVGTSVGGCSVYLCSDPDSDTVVNGFTLGETVTIAAAASTQNPIKFIGYYHPGTRPTRPSWTTIPTINAGSASTTLGTNWNIYYVGYNSTANGGFSLIANDVVVSCRFINSSTTAGRSAITGTTDFLMRDCDCISYRGKAITTGSGSWTILGCRIHDSDIGISSSTSSSSFVCVNNSIFGCVTNAISMTGAITASGLFYGNTLYGFATPTGTGLAFATGTTDIRLYNNIIYGFVTGVSHADTQSVGMDNYNDYYNNTADVSAATQWQKGANDVAVDPGFTNVVQVANLGTVTAGASDNTITDDGRNFTTAGVVAGRDYFYLVSGTNCTAGIYGITTVGTTTLVLDLDPTSSSTGSSIVYRIITGRDFSIGTNLKALGTPGVFPGGYTTGYMDIGAVQRQEPAGGGGTNLIGVID